MTIDDPTGARGPGEPDELSVPAGAAALVATRRRELTAALAEVDEAIDLERARLRELPGLPLPGTPGRVAAGPVPGAATGPPPGPAVGAAAVAARRLRELLDRRDQLVAGLRHHDLVAATPEECEKAALAWLNAVATPQQLIDELVADPAVRRPPFPLAPPPIPLRVAAAILRFREQQPRRRIRRLADLRAVQGVETPLLRHLLHTGCVLFDDAARPRPEPEPEPWPEPAEPRPEPTPPPAGAVGVLLPLRIETRFYPGRLRVRVIPDEPWFAAHDPRTSAGELDALGRYLAAVAVAPDDASPAQAWRELVGHVGGARAIFLLRAFAEPGPDGDLTVRQPAPSELREEPAFPRIDGFPPRLTVWLARGERAPVEVLTLDVDRDRLLADFPDPEPEGDGNGTPPNGPEPEPPDGPEAPADHRWWEDWDEAVAVGVAGEIALEGDPGDIDTLYVTGLGDGDPAALFASHRDEGRLAVLPPGTPTNTVDGAPAAPLGDDPDTWWDVLQTPAGESDRLISRVLTGDPDLLGALPGRPEPHGRWNSAIVAGLWPALWGFAGADVWNRPNGTNAAAPWATHALLPEGPFPTLRVGPQPYGLLPATALGRWRPERGDPSVEVEMHPALLLLRDAYRSAAEGRGTVVGAPTDRLLDLIGHVPTSPVLRHRSAWPLELWWFLLALLGFGISWEDLDSAWFDRHRIAAELGLRPARRYGAVAAPRRLSIPLVVPDELPEDLTVGDVLHQLIELALEAPSVFARTEILELEFLHFPPDSLLLRLAIRSLQVAIGDVGRALAGEVPPGPEPIARHHREPGRLERWIEGVPPHALGHATPEVERFRSVVEGLHVLAEVEPDRLERLLVAAVDTAAYRIDPWLLGMPTRRLHDLLDRQPAELRLGAYGWVDQPRPGIPGPTPAGLLHAPSAGQALTAAVLRDRAVNEPSTRWDLDLDSRSVRDADTVAEHVRVGAHLAEALGREVERVVADLDDVNRLRRRFPVRTEHEGRRVCDGLAVLAAPPGSLGLNLDQLNGLDRLRTTMDAYGDLLVAEAVHHVIGGRAEVAGAVMEAAAGLSRPPHLGLLRTPREGRAVTTSVVLALRDVAEPPLPVDDLERAEVSPAALADASAAAFVREHAGDAAEWTFAAGEVGADGTPVGAAETVTLADLGLLPADALALPRTDLERLAVEEAARRLGGDPAGMALVGGTGPDRYERGARLVALLGRRPAGPEAVTEQADAVMDEAPVDADLLARYTLVRDSGLVLSRLLANELALTTPDGELGTADAGTLTRLVVAARAWGVAPDPPATTTEAEPDPAAAERRLVATAARALELLAPRVGAAPDTAEPAPGEPAPAAALSRDDLVAALAALVSPTGQLAVTARMARADLPTLQLDPGLDGDWLPTIAAVREALARVEVHQLAVGTAAGTGAALLAWTNKPGDPWQRDAEDGRRMVVAYADPLLDLTALPASARVAVAAVDRCAEFVPDEEQTTAAAFGFDAPAARPPQAILLAVPPDPSAPWDERTVVDIVADTRLLARARMARPADLGADVRGLLPASLLPAGGATAVPLDPTRR